MVYDGCESKLMVSLDEEFPMADSPNGRILIPVEIYPYNLLIYDDGKARLVQYDYNEDRELIRTDCILSDTEIENIHRIYYPVFIES